MGPEYQGHQPPSEALGRSQRRGDSGLNRLGVPPPQMLVHTDRSIDANTRKAREYADEHGSVIVVAYARSGHRMLRHIRNQIGDGYSAEISHNDPVADPERYRRQQYVMRVTRRDGPSPPSGYGNPQQRVIESFAYRQNQQPSTDDPGG